MEYPEKAKEERDSSLRFSSVLGNPIRNFLWQFKQDARVNLSETTAEFIVEWFNPTSGKITHKEHIKGGKVYNFTPPFRGDAVLYLRRDVETTPKEQKNTDTKTGDQSEGIASVLTFFGPATSQNDFV